MCIFFLDIYTFVYYDQREVNAHSLRAFLSSLAEGHGKRRCPCQRDIQVSGKENRPQGLAVAGAILIEERGRLSASNGAGVFPQEG